jgi:hypothetical protein
LTKLTEFRCDRQTGAYDGRKPVGKWHSRSSLFRGSTAAATGECRGCHFDGQGEAHSPREGAFALALHLGTIPHRQRPVLGSEQFGRTEHPTRCGGGADLSGSRRPVGRRRSAPPAAGHRTPGKPRQRTGTRAAHRADHRILCGFWQRNPENHRGKYAEHPLSRGPPINSGPL